MPLLPLIGSRNTNEVVISRLRNDAIRRTICHTELHILHSFVGHHLAVSHATISAMSHDLPALLGGSPLRPQGEPAWPLRDPAIDAALHELAQSGDWGRYEGPHCEELERLLAERHQVEFVRLTSSGTAALEYALRGVGVQAGDEVILAAWDFKANFADVVALEATPVLVDVRRDDSQLNVAQFTTAITDRTRAVIASHLHGSTVDMPMLRLLCDEQNIALVEDACQMPLAGVHDRPAGTWGDVGVLSFGGSKTLSAGRGGAIVTNDPAVAQRIQLHDWRGNRLAPLSEMQAAVLVPQVRAFEERHAKRLRSVNWLREAFASCDGFRIFPPGVDRPDFYKVPFRYKAATFDSLTRERFCEAMHAEGITMSPSFPALHLTHSTRRFRAIGKLSNAAEAGEEVVVLHHPVLLMGVEELQLIPRAVAKIRAHAHSLKAL